MTMLPYEILVGLRGTMCTCARGIAGKQNSFKQLNVKVQNLYNFSTHSLKNRSSLQYIINKDVNKNNIRRFHTQFLANCQASPKDSKPIEINMPEMDTDPFDDMIDLKQNKYDDKAEYSARHQSSGKSRQTIPESVKSWLLTDIEKIPSKDIEKIFPEPKVFLHNLYTIATNETKIPHCLTSRSKPVNLKKKPGWSYTYDIKWPEQKSFTSVGHSKASAAVSAALKCLYWLHINDRIKNRAPVIYDKQEKQSIIKAPEKLEINKIVLDKINDFLDKHEENIKDAVTPDPTKEIEKFVQDNVTQERQQPISHLRVDIAMRNEILQERVENRKNITNPDLPIFQFESQILEELKYNQALVIKGDTGCGKTTQVPQFIMNHLAAKGLGGHCSMIVTQPRRISAISLAQRIAFERGEVVGDVVGYQVRLQQVLPKQNGAILFCTTGILLKKLQSNLKLEGCSHVIVDEAHERNVDTDMLLVLLRRAMMINPSLKVIVMSATINADLFQNYLGCNSVEVPGRLFPVKMHFLDDIAKLGISVDQEGQLEDDAPIVDCNQITQLIQWISQNKPPGAILCFLPGWQHIQRIQTNLEEYSNNSKQMIIPLHSRIPYITQSKIFDPPPNGVRKIILATDIAETGITVPDVVYVIDSACHKEVRWHENKGLSSINVHWVSQANIDQRKGRAGRVQEGESYHFITKEKYSELDEYPLPEVLRVSLEKTVLDGKTYSNEKAESFLGSMPQPPRMSAVRKAVYDLQALGALDDNQDLTALGKRIALFTIHPKLSKAMVYSTIFQCLSPVTTISSVLSLDSEIFYGSLENKSRIRSTKTFFHPTSDHLAIAWIYAQWLNSFSRGPQNAYQFCRKYRLHAERMSILHKVRDINLEHLRESGIIDDTRIASNLQSKENEYAVLDELTRGVLLAGMDQILKHRNFEVRKGRFSKSGTSLVTEDGANAQLSTECVNHKRTTWASPYLIYYQKTHHHERRTTLIRESSMISPVTVLLFSQGRIVGSMYKDENQNEDKVLLEIDGKQNVHLICDKVTAETILRFRDIMWSIVRYCVENNVDSNPFRGLDYDDELRDSHELKVRENIVSYKKEMMEILAHLLSSTSESIDAVDWKESTPSTDENLSR